MARITWTDQALDDLDSICEFIARDAPRYSQVFAEKVFEVIERLEYFPLSGRMVPELKRDDVREIILGNYRIIYRMVDKEVEILTIYHSAQLFSSPQPPEGD